MSISIETWQTWKRKNNPRVAWCPDGINAHVIECIAPTLLDYGFTPCGEDDDAIPKSRGGERTPRKIAQALVDCYGVQLGFNEFVYYVHAPSANYYAWILHLYGRKTGGRP